mgnify:CR=1 FL=1
MARISEINIETAPEAIQKIVADHVAEGHTITAEKRTLLHNAAAFNAVEAGSYALDDELASSASVPLIFTSTPSPRPTGAWCAASTSATC